MQPTAVVRAPSGAESQAARNEPIEGFPVSLSHACEQFDRRFERVWRGTFVLHHDPVLGLMILGHHSYRGRTRPCCDAAAKDSHRLDNAGRG